MALERFEHTRMVFHVNAGRGRRTKTLRLGVSVTPKLELSRRPGTIKPRLAGTMEAPRVDAQGLIVVADDSPPEATADALTANVEAIKRLEVKVPLRSRDLALLEIDSPSQSGYLRQ